MPLKRKRKRFLIEFLGTSPNAKKCTIENIDDVILIYNRKTRILEAHSHKPLIIHNHGLGYKITYFLDVFKWTQGGGYYRGNSLFQEDTCELDLDREKILIRRRKAYFGSRMQLFRELYIGEDGGIYFTLKEGNSEIRITEDSIVTSTIDGVKYLLPRKDITLEYSYQKSLIHFIEDQKVLFTKNGYFDPRYISWSGYISNRRIGDLLPYEYWP